MIEMIGEKGRAKSGFDKWSIIFRTDAQIAKLEKRKKLIKREKGGGEVKKNPFSPIVKPHIFVEGRQTESATQRELI